jgi:hypothetical protein
MSTADCKASRRKIIMRYGRPGAKRSVGQAIAEERARAARQAAAKGKKK